MFAMLNRYGKVIRISEEKLHPTDLYVIFPKIDIENTDEYIIQEKPMEEWEVNIKKNIVTVTYDIKKFSLEERKILAKEYFKWLHNYIKDGGSFIEINNEKLFINTEKYIIDSLNEYKTGDEWWDDPVQWKFLDENKIFLLKSTINNHLIRCDERLQELFELVENSQSIKTLHEISFLEGWPNTKIVTYENNQQDLLIMKNVINEDGYINIK